MLWLLGGAAAIVAGASTARSGSRVRWADLAARNGYPSTRAALRSWLPGGGRHLADSGVHLASAGLASPGGDGPVHIYPNEPITLVDAVTGEVPGSKMQWVPDAPGSNHGSIIWSDTSVVPPDAEYTSQSVQVTRNGVLDPDAHYTFDGRNVSGRIDNVNAGDVIHFNQRGTAVGGRETELVNIGGDVEPIRVPVPGQTDGGPGQWTYAGNESGMSAAPRYYQESVTHTAVPWTYQVNGKNFDGFYTDTSGGKHLLEAKGNYAWILDKNGNVVDWGVKTTGDINGQIAAQNSAASGTGANLDWYLQSPTTGDYFSDLAANQGAPDHLPHRSRRTAQCLLTLNTASLSSAPTGAAYRERHHLPRSLISRPNFPPV